MRVVLSNNFFLPRVSGSTHFTTDVATELSERGHDVAVMTCTPRNGQSDDLPFRVVRLPASQVNLGRFSFGYTIPFCTPAGIRTLLRELRSYRPDVVHLNEQFFDLSHYAGLWARKADVPRILTIHTAFTHDVPWVRTMLGGIDALAVSPLLGAVKPTLVTIDKFIDAYARRSFRHLPRQFIPVPVRIGALSGGDGTRVRRALNLGDRPTILSLGHVIPLRDRLLLIEALPAIRRALPDVCVIVVGKVHDERFLARASDLGVEDSLITVGEVARSDVKHYVAASHVECHETQSYGLGLASLEAMSSGIPVAAVVDEDQFPSFTIRDGEHLVRCAAHPESLADGLVRLLTDGQLRDQVCAAARALIEDWFALPRVVDRYLALYQQDGVPG